MPVGLRRSPPPQFSFELLKGLKDLPKGGSVASLSRSTGQGKQYYFSNAVTMRHNLKGKLGPFTT